MTKKSQLACLATQLITVTMFRNIVNVWIQYRCTNGHYVYIYQVQPMNSQPQWLHTAHRVYARMQRILEGAQIFFFLYIYLACNYRPLCNCCTYCMFGTKVLLWKRHYSDVGWRKVTSDDDVSFVQLKKKRKTHQPLKKWVYTARKNKKRKARRPARGMGTSSDGYRRREEDDRYFVIYRPLESSCGIFTVYSGIPENRIPVFCFGVSRYSTTSNNGTWRYKYRNFLGLLTITLTIVSALRAARCRWYRVRRSIIRGVRIHTTRTRYRVHSSTSMVVWYEVPPYIEFD